MCAICKGWTHQEVAAEQRHHITTIGWSVQMVEPRPGRVGWTYTIGLSESYGHPELLLLGRDVRADHEVLNRLGVAVRDGTTVGTGSSVVADLSIEAWEVHPVHLFSELVTSWRTVYEDRTPEARPELRFLQVREVPADETDRALRVRLDRPYARLPGL